MNSSAVLTRGNQLALIIAYLEHLQTEAFYQHLIKATSHAIAIRYCFETLQLERYLGFTILHFITRNRDV